MLDFIASWVASTPSFAVPYVLAALGLIISERSGVLNLTAEGLMLVGALVAVGVIVSTGSGPLPAMLAAAAAAAATSGIFAALTVLLRTNQVIAGLAMVFLCQGATSLVGTQLDWTNRTVPGCRSSSPDRSPRSPASARSCSATTRSSI